MLKHTIASPVMKRIIFESNVRRAGKNLLAQACVINSNYSHRCFSRSPSNHCAVVHLLGWTGCKEKNLKAYSDFYENLGFTVLKYCPSPSLVFSANPKKKLQRQSSHILENIFAKGLENQPMYFHNFSNGGVFMYYTLLQQIESTGIKEIKIAGTIFDSSPSPTTLGTTFGAAYSVCGGSNLLKTSVGSLAVGWIYFMVALNTLRAKCKGMNVDIERYRFYVAEALAAMPNQGPQHFLYSNIDYIIPDYGVEWFMEKRRKKGVSVSCTKFVNSTHVKHIIHYPDDYLKSLTDFISLSKEGFSGGKPSYLEAC